MKSSSKLSKFLSIILLIGVMFLIACDDGGQQEEKTRNQANSTANEEIVGSSQESNDVAHGSGDMGNQEAVTSAPVIDGDSGEGLLFELNEDGKSYTCVGVGTCTDAKIVIDTYEGLPVTSIGYKAFYDCDSLTSITILSGVRSIGERAFYDCDSLTSITIPNSVTDIGYRAFTNCKSLTSITIGNGITSIGFEMFRGCESLTSIAIPDSVTSILSCAFENCTSLKSITIPNSITDIDFTAFEDCASLTDIYFSGTEDEWNVIKKSNADIPSNATIHFNYTP